MAHPRTTVIWTAALGLAGSMAVGLFAGGQAPAPALPAVTGPAITAAECIAAKAGTSIPVNLIGAPVGGVELTAPVWTEPTATAPGYCRVDGAIDPATPGPTARPINFSVALPATWSRRAAQLGGGGFNGTIPNLTGGPKPERRLVCAETGQKPSIRYPTSRRPAPRLVEERLSFGRSRGDAWQSAPRGR